MMPLVCPGAEWFGSSVVAESAILPPRPLVACNPARDHEPRLLFWDDSCWLMSAIPSATIPNNCQRKTKESTNLALAILV